MNCRTIKLNRGSSNWLHRRAHMLCAEGLARFFELPDGTAQIWLAASREAIKLAYERDDAIPIRASKCPGDDDCVAGCAGHGIDLVTHCNDTHPTLVHMAAYDEFHEWLAGAAKMLKAEWLCLEVEFEGE